jgi:hypothetical protein
MAIDSDRLSFVSIDAPDFSIRIQAGFDRISTIFMHGIY